MRNYGKVSLIIFMFCIFISNTRGGTMENTFNLMPVPASVKWTQAEFELDSTFSVKLDGTYHPRLESAANRMLRRLCGRTGIFLTNPYARDARVEDAKMVINVKKAGEVKLFEDESYRLQVSADKITLDAETDIGALRGLETLLQLIDAGKDGYYFRGAEIEDAPRFPWRGLLIDVCRNFMPLEVIKRNLDGMAAVKLNVLHWHLSEDQGFRVECKTFPRLQELGSDGFYYTHEQVKEVIAYANDRGIRVIPEFDMPGHATSWLVGYPELGSAPGPYQIERAWGIFPNAMNPVNEYTYEFLDQFFAEMSALFPDPYFHIGGDEVEHKPHRKAEHWNNNPEIQKFMRENNIENNQALQAYFNSRLLPLLKKYGKIMVGWDEILHESMPKNIVIQSWRGRESMIEAARNGYQSILSNGYYIDLIQPASYHYQNDPLPEDSPLTNAQKELILGGEATMWAEFVSPETIDSRIWPRTAAIAERLWSPRNIQDTDDMYRRLANVSFRLEELGLKHEKNYPMLLRRLTGNQDINALKTLVDVIEPVKIYRRNRLREHFQHSPLTRVVDAARPDARVAREFRNWVAAYLNNNTADNKLRQQIETHLYLWKYNHGKLQEIIANAPVLKEIESLSADLSAIALIGLNALQSIEQNEVPDKKWLEESESRLKQAEEPRGQAELMVVSGIRHLLEAAASK